MVLRSAMAPPQMLYRGRRWHRCSGGFTQRKENDASAKGLKEVAPARESKGLHRGRRWCRGKWMRATEEKVMGEVGAQRKKVARGKVVWRVAGLCRERWTREGLGSCHCER